MMIKEAIAHLLDVGSLSALPKKMAQTDTEDIWLVRNGDTLEKFEFPREEKSRTHGTTTLEGFCDFMNGKHVDPNQAAIFVGTDEVIGDLAYQRHTSQYMKLILNRSPERMALSSLALFVSPKVLWRLMIAELAGHIPGELLSIVSALKVSKTTENSISIDEYGIESGGRTKSITLHVAGERAVIPVEWTFTGRVWSCWDQPVTLDLRLEIDIDDGLRFRFHIPNIDIIEQTHRLALVEEIKRLCPSIPVYEATLYSEF